MNQGQKLIFPIRTSLLIFITTLLFGANAFAAKPACLSPGAASKHIDINIYAGSDPVWASDNKCPGNAAAKDGDICMSINEKPDIKFILKGADKGDWEFIDFQLSADGITWPGTLPVGAYSDFEFGSDAALNTGKPYFSLSGPSMHVQNNNCHEFTVYYRVTLKETSSGKVVRLHPVMKNTGTE